MQILFYSYADTQAMSIVYPKDQGNPTVHNAAGGAGTLADPVTVGSASFAPGTILYFPYLEKYGVVEDACPDTACTKPPSVRVWAGGDASYTAEELQEIQSCETALEGFIPNQTSYSQVTINPASGMQVSNVPLYIPPSAGMTNGSCTAVNQ